MNKYVILAAFASMLFLSYPLCAIENEDTDKSQIPEVSEPDTPPKVIKSVSPRFPFESKRYNIEGRVVIRFVVTKEGKVEDPEITESIPPGIFDEAALEAIRQYQFQPATKNDIPVDCILNAPIEFSLTGTSSGYDAYKAADKGLGYTAKGEYDEAIEAFSKAIKIYRKYSAAYSSRGLAYMGKGDYKKAMADFTKAIEIDPDTAVFYLNRGNLYIVKEDYEKAIEDFNRAINLDKGMSDAYFNRGEAFRKSSKYQEAIQDYTELIGMDEDNVQAYNKRGYSYNKLKDMQNTCMDFKKACELGDYRGLEALQSAGQCSDNTADTSDAEGQEKAQGDNIGG